ncbi:MAG: CBS domain-containing protein [Desulfobacterales bacterium]|uniref:CBS domain-containing protein n=1 Tax=Candidatus Desulfatibia profunda TaxID=2841695 RepID=A0A8J6TJ60_9BACT|nr:CBS domain-containing protein [Candidatus Desulfatibia profunda]MBL7180383.1 CBS domain-containing protein [Desulfobacterales bacterium]
MKMKIVKDVMVPLSEYATASTEATLYEAVLALEKAQAEFDQTRYRHRAILIFDENNKIVGKISQIDILRALEPKYDEIIEKGLFARFGLSPMYQKSLIEQYKLWNKPLNDICRKAAQLKVKTFMTTPTEGEFVDENASLDEAVNQLIIGKHQSLLVTRDKAIVGILRLTDVFVEIARNIKECKL